MNSPFYAIEQLSLNGNTWNVRPWYSRSLEENQGYSREGDTSVSFGDGKLESEVARSVGLSSDQPPEDLRESGGG